MTLARAERWALTGMISAQYFETDNPHLHDGLMVDIS
jgi:hypothetical protein